VQPAVKIGFETWPSPYAAATVGYLVSAAVVVAFAGLRGGLPSVRDDRAGILWFAAVGLCNGAAVVTMYAALARGPVALVAPLVATYPLVTLVLGAVLLRGVRIGPRIVAGVTVTVAGVVLLLATR
jgi:drug/metabolite transporter (DMT)-like permease